MNSEDVFPSSFSLTSCTNLESIVFGPPAAYSPLFPTDDISPLWIQHMLSQIYSKRLSKICLWIDCADEVQVTRGEWDEILERLTSDQFASVKTVEIRLTESRRRISGSFEMMKNVEKHVQSRLKKLVDNGRLVIGWVWIPSTV